MNIDNYLVSSLLLASRQEVVDTFRKVDPKLVAGEERDVYKFIRDHFIKHRAVPSVSAVKQEYEDFRPVKPKDTLAYYVGEIERRWKYENLTKLHADMSEDLLNKNVDGAIEKILGTTKTIAESDTEESKNALSDLNKRINKYYTAKKNEGVIGTLTGIDTFDRHIGGISTEYFVILGRRGVGKTFMLLKVMKGMAKNLSGSIAVISNEMDTEAIYRRLDSEFAEIPYGKYRRGELTPEQEKRLRLLKKMYKKLPEIRVINGAGKSVQKIEYELEAIADLSLICVDGIYLTDMGKNDEYGNTVTASRSYQRLGRKKGLPIIATSQMTDDNQSKYARGIEEDADIVLKVWQSKAMRDQMLMGFEALKIREDDVDLEWMMRWNFNDFIFEEYAGAEGEPMEYT